MTIDIRRNSIFSITAVVLLNIIAIAIVNFAKQIVVNHLVVLTIFNIAQTALILSCCLLKNRLKRRFAFFSFNVAYFILLQGSYVMNIGNAQFYGTHVFAYVSTITYLNEARGLMYILLAQAITFISYELSELKRTSIVEKKDSQPKNILGIRKWSTVFLIVGGIAAFTKLILKIAYVASVGYIGTYLQVGSALYENAFLDLFDKFYYLGLYGYLATFPPKKEIKKYLNFFLVYSALTILTGIRGELVVNCLFIIWYLSKRDEVLTDEKKILNSRAFIFLFFVGILSFSLLYEYGFSRLGKSSSESGIINRILRFIDTQGGSGRLVALGLQNKEEMLKYISPFLMLIYPIRNFLINNSIVRIFSGGVIGQNLNSLKYAPSFGSVLTYITNQGAYLNGSAMGTSYVAEMAVSFGFVGVIVFSLIIGRAFSKIDSIQSSNWSKTVLLMNAFVVLVYIPRHGLLQIIPESVATLLFVFIVNILVGNKAYLVKKNEQ